MTDDFENHDEHTIPNPNLIDRHHDSISSVKPSSPPLYSTSQYSNPKSIPPPPSLRESAARERIRRRRVNGSGNRVEWAWLLVAGAMFVVVIVISLSIFLVLRSSQERVVVMPTADVTGLLPTAVVAHSEFANISGFGNELQLPDGSSIALTPWDGQSRFTMVMVGLDRRPGEDGLAYRTDTMMLLSIDPVADAIGVLSIPRDLYVPVPGYASLQRINTPMVLGEYQRPGYGPTLMMQTVQSNLGIRVHDYVAVDFDAVITFVDVLGGIEVTTDYTINDPQYPNMFYGYDPFYLVAGTHLLNGYDALRFARTRHGDSDIRRAERQQQVLYAIRDKVLSADMIPQLLLRSPEMWANLSDNLYTGLSLEQIIQLALYVKDIPTENIRMGVIGYEYLQGYTTGDGASVLIPNRARLGNLMVDVFGETYSQ